MHILIHSSMISSQGESLEISNSPTVNGDQQARERERERGQKHRKEARRGEEYGTARSTKADHLWLWRLLDCLSLR